MFSYTRSQLISDINVGIRGKIGMIANQVDFINRVVREFRNEVPIRSGKRKNQLTPDLFNGVYQYACPSDLHDARIIDIPAQATRADGSFGLVPVEQFNVRPQPGDIAIDNYNGVKTLLIKSQSISPSVTVNNTSAIDSWVSFGDGENVIVDNDDFILGNGSISFDISGAGGTTAGIQNDNIDTLDISAFLGGTGAAFTWAKINSPTNITNYVLRIGTDSSNYYTKTITTRSDGNAFERGWNLLRFDLTGLVETGSVDDENINYVALYMTKTSGKISETQYKFNTLIIKKGIIHNVLYYSKFGWQTSTGAYIQNSTDALDVVVADDTEYDLIVKKGIAMAMPLTNFDMAERSEAMTDYKEAKDMYMFNNPEESMIMVSTYYYE
jgi:hypothetical protein